MQLNFKDVFSSSKITVVNIKTIFVSQHVLGPIVLAWFRCYVHTLIQVYLFLRLMTKQVKIKAYRKIAFVGRMPMVISNNAGKETNSDYMVAGIGQELQAVLSETVGSPSPIGRPDCRFSQSCKYFLGLYRLATFFQE